MDKKRLILIILDGFGASAYEEGNAVLNAKTTCLDYVWGNFPKTLLRASGEEVGLSWGEIGNSEVGHLNLGTGRISEQDLPRIDSTIANGSFFENEYLVDACEHAKKHNSKLHLAGLLSNGKVHADIGHLLALLKLAKARGVNNVAIHIFTDGRDMPKKSAGKLVKILMDEIGKSKTGTLTSMIGRFYAMDRDNNWDRIEKAYHLMVSGVGTEYKDVETALEDQYKKGLDDENIGPVIFNNKMLVEDNDAMIFYNIRSDRARQLSETFISRDFNKFGRSKIIKNLRFITFVSYGNEQTPLVDVAYLADKIDNQLSKIISEAGMSQIHAAESEKYAHVTYFFNGGEEKPFAKESRILIDSPKVDTYSKKPEMSAERVSNEFITKWNKDGASFAVINFANPDMVGHTGDYNAAIEAINTVDVLLKKILTKCKDENTSVLITADHGNAEQMINPQTKEIDKQHTTNPVPFSIIGSDQKIDSEFTKKIEYQEKLVFFSTCPSGVLADISPTIINLLGLKKPTEMNGINLNEII